MCFWTLGILPVQSGAGWQPAADCQSASRRKPKKLSGRATVIEDPNRQIDNPPQDAILPYRGAEMLSVGRPRPIANRPQAASLPHL